MNCSNEGIEDSCHKGWLAFRIIFAGLFPFVGIVGNLMVILVIGHRKITETKTNYLIINLSVADIVFCLQNLVFSLPAIAMQRWPYPMYVCRIRATITSFAIGTTIFTMFLISVVRYCGIIWSHKHFDLFENKIKLIGLIISVWVFCILLGIPPLRHQELCGFAYWNDDCNLMYYDESQLPYYLINVITFLGLPALTMPYFYGRIFYVTMSTRKKVAPSIGQTTQVNGRLHLKLSIMFCTIYVCFIAIYVPYIVFVFMHIWGKSTLIRFELAITAYLLNIQGVINPFIYGALNQEFRGAYLKLVQEVTCTCRMNGGSKPHEANAERPKDPDVF